MIYIACPYTHPEFHMREKRYEEVTAYTAWLMQQKLDAFSPISYGHQFALRGDAQTDHEWWMTFNEQLLMASREMHILMLDGWDTSAGVAHEIEFANRYHIPIHYIVKFGQIWTEAFYENL